MFEDLRARIDEIEDEEVTAKQTFVIATDEVADWALTKIAKAREKYLEAKRLRDAKVIRYDTFLLEAKKESDQTEAYFTALLSQYMDSLDFEKAGIKPTKTKAVKKLPSGKLVYKLADTKLMCTDDEKLVAFVKANTPEHLKIVESVAWGELKKTLSTQIMNTVNEDTGEVETTVVVVDSNGEIVDGVEAVVTDRKFEVEL